MRLVRNLERRLENMLDGVAGMIFQGPLHPSELAGAIIRRMDLDVSPDHVAPNVFVVEVPRQKSDSEDASDIVARELAVLVEEAAAERGWRLEGPVAVAMVADGGGAVRIRSSVEPGPRRPWATLVGESTFELTKNRSTIGRSPTNDVVIDDDTVSRLHATVWTEDGSILVRDHQSSNGTTVEGVRVGDERHEIPEGSIVAFGTSQFRLKRRRNGDA